MHALKRNGDSGFTLVAVLVGVTILTSASVSILAFSNFTSNSLQSIKKKANRDLVLNRIKGSLQDPRALTNTLADTDNLDFRVCNTGKNFRTWIPNGCRSGVKFPVRLRDGNNEALAGGSAVSSVLYYTADGELCKNADGTPCTSACPDCVLQATASFTPDCGGGKVTCTQNETAKIEFAVAAVSGVEGVLSRQAEGSTTFTPGALVSGGTCPTGRVMRGYRDKGFLNCWIWQLPVWDSVVGLSDIRYDSANNVYVTGYTRGKSVDPATGQTYSGVGQLFVSKFTPDMSPLWTKQFGTSSYDTPTSMRLDPAGNIYIGGATSGALTNPATGTTFTRLARNDPFIIKLDPDGSMVWAYQFGQAGANITVDGMSLDNAGNIVIGGSISGAPWAGNVFSGQWWGASWRTEPMALWIAKFSQGATGPTRTWLKQLNAGLLAGMYDLAVAPVSGDIYFVGENYYNLVNPNFQQTKLPYPPGPTYLTDTIVPGTPDAEAAFLVKYDSSGAFQWGRQFGSNAWDAATSVVVDSTETNIFVAGTAYGTLPGYSFNGAAFIANFDPAGARRWIKAYIDQDEWYAEAFRMTMNPAGTHLFLTGYSDGVFPGNARSLEGEPFIGKFDLAGNQVWVRQFGMNFRWGSGQVLADPTGNAYAIFTSRSPTAAGGFVDENGPWDNTGYVVKLDASGR